MANGRNPKRKGHDSGRDAGGFFALPWTVLDCPAFSRLSHPAKALLMELGRQFVRDNNGRLLLSRAHLAKRGWSSNDTINRAKAELLASGFIFETVKGHRPNKASWYAVTWRALDRIPGYDPGAVELFRRSAYQDNQPLRNASLTPASGQGKRITAPTGGLGRLATTPASGAIRGSFAALSAPPHGHHLDMPSVGVKNYGSYRRLTRGCTGLFSALVLSN
ncbi:hypothetical protein AEP_00810 [Curvibacter sp. AEP1-3]|nr:hypothetical protein AEP_00810 [Curvibacter sp. AEP1-3]